MHWLGAENEVGDEQEEAPKSDSSEEDETYREQWTTVKSKSSKRRAQRKDPEEKPVPKLPSQRSIGRPAAPKISSVRAQGIAEGRVVVVHGLTDAVTKEHLIPAFESCGTILEAEVERDTLGRSRGFGYVVFKDASSASMVCRDGPRLDGKLSEVRLDRPRDSQAWKASKMGVKKEEEDASTAEARQQVLEFLNVHEIVNSVGFILSSTDPKVALRAIRGVEACSNGTISETLLMSELHKATGNQLSKTLENNVALWVSNLKLSDAWKQRVEALVVAQRPLEIEHLLELGSKPSFVKDLANKENPCHWILSLTQRFRREQTVEDIKLFCDRFDFEQSVKKDLCELSAERARRLMRSWRPGNSGGMDLDQHKAEFRVQLSQATVERRHYIADRSKRPVTAQTTHARILASYADNELEEEEEEAAQAAQAYQAPAAGSGSHRRQVYRASEDFLTFDANMEASSSTSAPPKQRNSSFKPLATHFVLCVDASGSMTTADCIGPEGKSMTRLEAVRITCDNFMAESNMRSADLYSFITFNEHCMLHFSQQPAVEARSQLGNLHFPSRGRTFYARGIQGIEVAMKHAKGRQPTHVVFLSDGEPSDPNTYLQDLKKLLHATRVPLRIYTVGFGQSAKVTSGSEEDFMFLQQLAQLGHGHFQKAGASLHSLQGAFTAVSSTISGKRSSCSAGSLHHSTLEHLVAGMFSNTLSGTAWTLDGDAVRRLTDGLQPTIDEANECDSSDCSPEEMWQRIEELGVEPEQVELEALLYEQRNCPSVDFEKPDPAAIWKDCTNSALWRSFTAAETSVKFDGHHFSESVAVHKVFLRKRPFAMGGMRLVYGMVLENGMNNPSDPAHMMCGKISFQDLVQDVGFKAHKNFSRCTAVAQYYAKVFRKKTGFYNFGFLNCSVYSPINIQEKGHHFCGEAWMKGHFVKLNSNNGYVNEAEFNEHSEIAQAFSHFTFDHSNGQLLVVDLQGICGGSGEDVYFCLTDPQVHSRGAFQRFGNGDLQDRGIRAFFQKHVCNEVCHHLRLRQEYVLSEPTHVHSLPGVQAVLQHMLSGNASEFFANLRRDCQLSSITVPREAHAEWVDVQIWAGRRGGEKAKAALEERAMEYYSVARKVVDVDPVPAWSPAVWEEQVIAWKIASGAPIIPYPPEWRESTVTALWVFSQRMSYDKYEHRQAQTAERIIKEALRKAAEGLPRQAAAASNQVTEDQKSTWTRYQDREKRIFWKCSYDGAWFWEAHPKPWQQFSDGSRLWWWNSDTGDWFYEPE